MAEPRRHGSTCPRRANVDVIAIGRAQLPLTTIGLAMGVNVRVGLEDNVRYSRTELARDNAHLVERTVRIAHELQLEPATPAQARERLGTRGRSVRRRPGARRRSGEAGLPGAGRVRGRSARRMRGPGRA